MDICKPRFDKSIGLRTKYFSIWYSWSKKGKCPKRFFHDCSMCYNVYGMRLFAQHCIWIDIK